MITPNYYLSIVNMYNSVFMNVYNILFYEQYKYTNENVCSRVS